MNVGNDADRFAVFAQA